MQGPWTHHICRWQNNKWSIDRYNFNYSNLSPTTSTAFLNNQLHQKLKQAKHIILFSSTSSENWPLYLRTSSEILICMPPLSTPFCSFFPPYPFLSLSLPLFNSLSHHPFHHFTLLILYFIISSLWKNKNVAFLSWSIAYHRHNTLGL